MIQKVARPSRRAVVALAAAGALGGCSGAPGESPPPRAPAPPGAALRTRAAADSLALLARYDAAAATHQALAGRLAPLRAEVARHARAFGGKPPASPASPASPVSPTSSASPASSGRASAPVSSAPPTSPAPIVPATPAAALSWLASAERDLADRRAAALVGAPGDLARLMASVAAAGAGHVALLTTGAPRS